MRFDGAIRRVCLISLCGAAFVVGCGDRFDGKLSIEGGEQANLQAAFFRSDAMTQLVDDNTVVAVDPVVGRLQWFRLNPFKVLSSWETPIDDDHLVVHPGGTSAWALVMGRDHYAVAGREGVITDDSLVPLEGSLRLATMDADAGVAVIGDDQQKMALLMFDLAGNLTRGKTLGQLVANRVDTAATILSDGRLVVASGSDTLSVVDVSNSIATQAWSVSSSFTVTGARSMAWLRPVSGSTSLVLVGDSDRLLVVNVDTQAIVETRSLSGYEWLGTFDSKTPHLVARTGAQRLAGRVEVFSVESGVITSRVVSWNGMNVTASMLHPDGGHMALVGSPLVDDERSDLFGFETRDVSWIRLTDGATLMTRRLNGRLGVALAPDYLFSRYPSTLGYARRETWDDEPSTRELAGFNLRYLR